MSAALIFLTLLLCMFLSAVYSGSETGFYSLSRLRLEADVRDGRRRAWLVRYLVRDERSLLIAILVADNLMLELTTTLGDELMGSAIHLPAAWREIALTLALTPLVFVFAELLPKDLFRRRPHSLMGGVAPLLAATRVLIWPLTAPLWVLSACIERLLGTGNSIFGSAVERNVVLELLDHGERGGTLEPQARKLAQNALRLSTRTVGEVMVPWDEVVRLEPERGRAVLQATLRGATHTRLPLVDADGGVRRYVHQLELLSQPGGDELGAAEIEAGARPLPTLAAGTPLHDALAALRTRGQRLALVGSAEQPLGVATLKDLVEEISGELAGW